MKFDVLGRINNMRLPDGKTAVLYSVYEAVSNSTHAINDRFTEGKAAEQGKVDVNIIVDGDGDLASISITDNGVGLPQKIWRHSKQVTAALSTPEGERGLAGSSGSVVSDDQTFESYLSKPTLELCSCVGEVNH